MKVRNCKKEESQNRWSRSGRKFILLSVITFLTAVILAVSPSAWLSSGGKAEKLLLQEADANTDTDAGAKQEDQEDKEFSVYFINVGQGDASLIICDGHSMLIDGGGKNQSDKIYAFLKNKEVTHLDYIVATHPDDDHIGGLAGALNYADVDIALSSVANDDSQSFQSFKKYLDLQGVLITIPKAGDCYPLGSSSITILGPIEIAESDNNNSLVLKVDHGDNSFLYTGDAEKEEETDILNTNADLKSTVLKIGHHGSPSSTSEVFLSVVDPVAAVISCGIDNEYGHPAEEVLERLKNSGIQVLRTDLQGDILFYEDEGELSYVVERNLNDDGYKPRAGIAESAQHDSVRTKDSSNNGGPGEEPSALRSSPTDSYTTKIEMAYIVNIKTGKFHYPDCRGAKQMKESNKQYVTCDRQELIQQGYESCGICHP